MSETTPTFAVVGAVNHGKSSVVSTLAENDQIRISSMPGETMENQRFKLRDLFVFYDTPGFQNPLEALPELTGAAQARDPLSVFREFISKHASQPEFEAECRLFQPIVDGAGIVYVVDGSEPLIEIHTAEMEILRLTGAPRLAIINRTGTDNHIADWKRRLGLHFNAVREFNAHHATFADRVELLETLAGIEQSWKPKLARAVTIYREEWQKRLGECAEVLVELLFDTLTHRLDAPSPELASRREAQAEELRKRYLKSLADLESQAHREIIELFGHSRVKAGEGEQPHFADDLFSEETWKAFGLDDRQLLAAGAASGAAAGVVFDLATAGHTIGLPTIFGTVAGAAGAFFVGRRRPELKVSVPGLGNALHLGGRTLSIGPCTALNFPWILLDRALGVFAYVANRAHARRDETTLDSTLLKSTLDACGLSTAQWPADVRRDAEKIFVQIRKDRAGREAREALRAMFKVRLAMLQPARA